MDFLRNETHWKYSTLKSIIRWAKAIWFYSSVQKELRDFKKRKLSVGRVCNEWRNSRLNRTTVNVRMFCPPVYYQRYTSFATDTHSECVRGKTRFCCDSFLLFTINVAFFLLFCLFFFACVAGARIRMLTVRMWASVLRPDLEPEKREMINRKSHTCVMLRSTRYGSSAR